MQQLKFARPYGRALSASSSLLTRQPLRSLSSLQGQWPPLSQRQTSRRTAIRPIARVPVARCHSTLRQTALHDFHQQHGGKMVPFGGFSMPVQYADQSIVESHKFTREKASLFDVGHMVQHRFYGQDAKTLLERITPATLSSLAQNTSTLSCLLLPTGGIVDDLVITRCEDDSYYVVTNAGRREEDHAFIKSQIDSTPSLDLGWSGLNEHGLLALQGPEAAAILESVLSKDAIEGGFDLKELYFGQCGRASLLLPDSGHLTEPVLISRGGYTGEDGFELSTSPGDTLAVAQGLLAAAGPDRLRLAGLGARDSLRLEAGMCLYGQDLSEDVTPVEAGLGWVVSKQRREGGGFNGADTILPQLLTKKNGGTGVTRRRVGLVVQGAPARTGAKIVHAESGEELGTVTSGVPSPTLGKNIAMGYVKSGYWKSGTQVGVEVRGKRRSAEVVKMPFVPNNFYRAPESA